MPRPDSDPQQDDPLGQQDAKRVDEWLRDALEDRPEVAHRLARRALEATPPASSNSPTNGLWRLKPLWLTVATALLAAVIWWPAAPPQPLQPLPEPGADRSPAPAPLPAELRLSNESGFVTVTSTAGSQWIILPGAAS